MLDIKSLSSQQLKALIALRQDRLLELILEEDEIRSDLKAIIKELESRAKTPV